MKTKTRKRRALAISLTAVSVGLIAACSTSGQKPMLAKKRSLEYFSESEYGVKASPRVTNLRSNLPRGGGRDQTGKPYQVRGKWYYPKEDKKYVKKGGASWYGDAFHGRLTANGEIYDMTHLTAAHPTMPLPSYARVTNMADGSSVIVRVNDRGPYADGRIIDLSRRAAEMLNYSRHGIATVKVEYVGRAPLDGEDTPYLLASYRPGNAAPNSSDGLPTGVMIAMNGATPDGKGTAQAFPGQLSDGGATSSSGSLQLPDVPPVLPSSAGDIRVALAGYAPQGGSAATAFAAMDQGADAANWKAAAGDEFIVVGSYEDFSEAAAMTQRLAAYGRIEVATTQSDGKLWQTVNLRADGRYKLDDMLRAAWKAGAVDAMTVHE